MESNNNLCWANFETHVTQAWRDLRATDADLCDITLAVKQSNSDELALIPAHKVILSASSNFFGSLFRQHGSGLSYFHLHDINLATLEAILDFIYRGEVRVDEKDLDSFMSVANDLQLKGLIFNSSDKASSSGAGPSLNKRAKMSHGDQTEAEAVKVPEVQTEVKNEPVDGDAQTEKKPELLPLPGNGCICTACNVKFKTWKSGKDHFSSKHSNVQITCKMCEKTFIVKNSFMTHINKFHEIKGAKNIIGTYGIVKET